MKAIVLAGGYATRLRPISYALPKLLFPVLGKPMIYWTLDLLKKFGVNEVVLAVNYLADALRTRVGTTYRGMRIKYSLEKTPLGTGGPIKLASCSTRLREPFIAMNGDVIAEIDISKMLAHHARTGAAVTDALREVSDPRRFGMVQLDSKGRIKRFIEKPELSEASTRLVNAGIYIIEPKVIDMISAKRQVSLEREIFPILARRGRLGGFPFSGYWFDIGSLSDYRVANFRMLEMHAGEAVLRERITSVATGAALRYPSFLDDASKVETKAIVGPYAIVGRNGLIGRSARVSNSVLFDRVIIGEGTKVSGAIIASDVITGDRVRIGYGAVVSPDVRIADGAKVGINAIIHPHKEIIEDVKAGTHVM